MKIVVVGGVAGGATFAARMRRLDEKAQIVIFERGEYISFANCGLPYHIGGAIPKRDSLVVQTPEGMRQRYAIDVRTRQEVVGIDREKRQVQVIDHRTGSSYAEGYDVLVLSPGAMPIVPPGIESSRVFTLRTMDDMDRIIHAVQKAEKGRAVIVGGGFIGLEMAENLRRRGFEVTIVDMAEQVMLNLDREMAAIVQRHLRSKGVRLVLKDGIVGVRDEAGEAQVKLSSGRTVEADIVILSIGVRPEATLAREAGLELGPRGGIKVDSQFRTSDPHIYAIGDVAEVPEFGTEGSTWVPLAGPANRQARLLADVIAGRKVHYDGVQGTAIAKVFDLSVATVGKNERALKREGRPYRVSITHTNSHAGYYPGASQMSIKLIFGDAGEILGAQIVGCDGVDKRIDTIATTMRLGGTVYDLSRLELAYAPPFSSAKDPVNIAGYVASNILQEDVFTVQWHEVAGLDPEDTVLLDVREPAEVQMGSIPGGINIPLGQLRQNLDKLPRDKRIVVYCQVGLRAYVAARILTQNGFSRVYNLSGGYKTYHSVIQDQEQGEECCPAGGGVSGEVLKPAESATTGPTLKVDACGLQCPGPIVQLHQTMKELAEGDTVEITATDPGFMNDVKAWCDGTGNALLYTRKEDNRYVALIKKGGTDQKLKENGGQVGLDKTLVIFSDDLDRAIASFVIANGAAAMGRKVTMFFTFWGLNVLRRQPKAPVEKGTLDRMFGMMMPRGSRYLGLSKMNMLGIGPRLMRHVMNKKHIASLEELIEQAKKAGVRLVACQMSMDVMGIKPQELIDGVEIGGVATYLAAAERANVNLFI
ncbi:MAG TPA: FAD-dependent oxidoreductase [Firmicutes bacterium]|nr:FAD-dependent oxidoreductase [Bacillota bacterium]